MALHKKIKKTNPDLRPYLSDVASRSTLLFLSMGPLTQTCRKALSSLQGGFSCLAGGFWFFLVQRLGAVTPTKGENMIALSLFGLSQAHGFSHQEKAAGVLLFNERMKWG